MEKQEKQEKLDSLRVKCLTFNAFFAQKFGNGEGFSKMIEEIEKAYRESKLNILDILNKDYQNQIKEMPYSYVIELKKILLEKTGENLDNFQKLVDKKIKIIEKKGIKNIEEYTIIHNEVENIWSDITQKEKLDILNKLLTDWHIKNEPQIIV